jgi:hypothetical protein
MMRGWGDWAAVYDMIPNWPLQHGSIRERGEKVVRGLIENLISCFLSHFMSIMPSCRNMPGSFSMKETCVNDHGPSEIGSE